ncbi:MAG: hypothetical protein IKJ55_00450 [Clostridia bacterium]|nr:hypothetical protein [Clostridia bacterium]
MKLSKQIIATLLVLSMLLITMPVFAEEVAGSESVNTREIFNEKVKLPTDGSSVTLTNTYCGTQSGMSLVLDTASAKALGIDVSTISGTISTSLNTDYAGILLSGAAYLTNWTYRPGATSDTHVAINNVLVNQATYFEFEDVEVSHIRKSSGGLLVVEIPYDKVREKATNVKMYGGDVDFSALTENTEIEKIEKDADSLTTENFASKNISAYLVKDLTARAGENYWGSKDINLGSLPEGTKFFATSPENLTYFGAEYGYTDDWIVATDSDMRFYNAASNAFDGNMSGPFSIAKPNFSGEYYVYGLRKDCSNSGPRIARFNISGQKFTFKDLSLVTWKSTDPEWSNKDSFFWDKAVEGTITLEAGKPYYFQNCGNGSSRLVAVAFVPVNAEGFSAPAAIVKENDLKYTYILEAFTDEDFTIDYVKTYTVKVDGEDFTVKPYYHQVHSNASNVDVYDYAQNVFGQPIKYATVAEVVALAKGVTVAEATANYQITVNGVREYAPDVMIAMPGDEIVVGTEALNSMNFNPIHLEGKLVRFLMSGTNLRVAMHATTVPAYLYDKDVHTTAATAPFADAKIAGYLIWDKDDEYKGQKVYFLSKDDNGASTVSGDKSLVIPHFANYGTNTAFPTVTAETPDGTKTVHNPFKVYAIDKQESVGTKVISNYITKNMYWVNGTTTNDIRVVEVNGKKVIRTDGCALIRVITKKADGSVETERFDLTPKDMYVVDAQAGETVYVWEDTPWDGISMIPVCEPIVAQ